MNCKSYKIIIMNSIFERKLIMFEKLIKLVGEDFSIKLDNNELCISKKMNLI